MNDPCLERQARKSSYYFAPLLSLNLPWVSFFPSMIHCSSHGSSPAWEGTACAICILSILKEWTKFISTSCFHPIALLPSVLFGLCWRCLDYALALEVNFAVRCIEMIEKLWFFSRIAGSFFLVYSSANRCIFSLANMEYPDRMTFFSLKHYPAKSFNK